MTNNPADANRNSWLDARSGNLITTQTQPEPGNILESSQTLSEWKTIESLAGSGGIISFNQLNATSSFKFYRARAE
jgi:hypothetical protein